MSDQPLLSVRNLRKHYPIQEGVLNREVGRVRAVDGIDFELFRGETLGLVGESGCGKSTAASSLLRLEEPTLHDPDVLAGMDAAPGGGFGSRIGRRFGLGSGGDLTDAQRERLEATRTRIEYDGEDIMEYDADQLKAFRREAQMIFQDPKSTFDPRMTVGESMAEPLRIHGLTDRQRRRGVVEDLLERVGLAAEDADRYPHEFSGGQKQRIALARALVVDPDLLVADEPVSALDVSIQANILRLMSDLQEEFGLSILFISHDLGVVREICDRVAVMYLGEIVEVGPTEELFTDPKHPYTRALLASIPTPDPRQRGIQIELVGDVPSASDPPAGCRFHTRCPEVIQPADLDLDQDHWKHVMHFRDRIRRREVDVDALESAAGMDLDGDVTSDRLAAEIRDEFGLPETMDDETAEAVIDDAVAAVASGDIEEAENVLAETFETPCERETPDLVRVGDGHEAACHRNERSDVDTVAVRSRLATGDSD